ncbi:hypothetical protein [Achromobacter sp. AGC39]
MQLTKVYLEGALGARFGREWELAAKTPRQALKLLRANEPEFIKWMAEHQDIYSLYTVSVEFEDGSTLECSDDAISHLPRRPVSITFEPVIEGAGAAARIVVGVVLLVVSAITYNPAGVGAGWTMMFAVGASLTLGGLVGLLTSSGGGSSESKREDKTSYFFNGPTNTEAQGVPVPLIYGDEVLVGSHCISASLSVDQLM